MDRAVASARARGLYLEVVLFDELGYHHGGKRDWVELFRPGTTSTSPRVSAATSRAQRGAEAPFSTDRAT